MDEYTLYLHDDPNWVRCDAFDFKSSVQLQAVPGRVYDRSLRVYLLPCSQQTLDFLTPYGYTVDELVHQAILDRGAAAARARVIKGAVVDEVENMPVTRTPWQHQQQAYSFVMELFG